MELLDIALLDQVSGGRGNNRGDRTDNGGRTNGKGNKGNGNNSSGFYGKNTSEDCINGMLVGAATGSLGGLPGAALDTIGGAITGGCFKDSDRGGGNVGMGKGGNKCGSSSGGTCSW